MHPARQDITGLVVCGGLATRMGGVDKGLQQLQGRPLVQHVLDRLAPQVGPLMLNANRHLARYRALGLPVWPDTLAGPLGHFGPLAGWLAGLQQCATPYLATVPCDSPALPLDLVQRLAAALHQADADIAMAATRPAGGSQAQPQPVFCLLKAALKEDLAHSLQSGERKIGRWVAGQRCVQVLFEDTAAFFNANTPEDLAQLQGTNQPREQPPWTR